MKYIFIALMALLLIFSGCAVDEEDTQESVLDIDVPEDFDFTTEKEVSVEVSLTDAQQDGIPGVVYDLYYLNDNNEAKFIRNNMTNTVGVLNTVISVPSYVENVMISGFMNSVQLAISSDNQVEYDFHSGAVTRNFQSPFTVPEISRSFSTLPGMTFNNQGVPNPHDIYPVTTEMLLRVDTSLPERVSLLETHPQYLENTVETNFIITDSSNVWITFVTEGAGYYNALGFYTYDLEDGAPADPEDLEHILIFPNASLDGEGGELDPGMQVYLGQFGAGTVMGWFLVQNGWISGANVDTGAERFYTDEQYNPESEEFNQHQVLLYDSEAELFLIAFDDQERPFGDQDFNDAVFFATADPIENIDTSNIEPIDIPVDSDDDGVNDPFDEFPDDPLRAFYVHYPAENETATLVFEDKWPQYGDYDMNDMVLDYNYRLVTNASDEVKDIRMEFSLRAAGAFFNNGFSVQIPYLYDNLTITAASDNISPQLVRDELYTIVDLFSNTSDISGLSPGVYLNTEPEDPYYEPVSFSVDLVLEAPMPLEDLDFGFPYNPFVLRQGAIAHEIHLMDYADTARHNDELFGSEDDASDPASGSYFVSPLNLPWGLNLPESWEYPVEKASIVETYLNFANWAESGGTANQDWYLNTPQNIEAQNLYLAP